ncbi:MAG: hypothetical protein ACXAEN_27190 [Candidatus Thorarchaeota archaeon]|jgi:hypothetical protein
MKAFVLRDVLCDYTCGCIIVQAKNKKEAADKIREKRGNLYGMSRDEIEEYIEEIDKGYYLEVWGGS